MIHSLTCLKGSTKNFVYVSTFQVPPPKPASAIAPASPIRPPDPPSIDFETAGETVAFADPWDVVVSEVTELEQPLLLCSSPDPFCNFSQLDRSLLNHFVNSTAQVMSCHPLVRDDLCRAVVPAALENPALFYATMALSAIHRKSQAGVGSVEVRHDPLVIHLLSNSLQGLQRGLLERDTKKVSVLFATVRTLFVCEIHLGGDRPGTWRAHFEGAKALMHKIESWEGYSVKERDSTEYFLKRWYNMAESFVALTSDSLASGKLARFEAPTLKSSEEVEIYLDEYLGFTSDLTSIFCEIGAAAWERRKSRSMNSRPTILFESDLDEEAIYLEQLIRNRIEHDRLIPPRFRPELEPNLSESQIREFYLCNEAWHHMALIHIHRQISGLPALADPVQESVERILECAEGMTATPGLTPLVVMTSVIFTAGCEAFGRDRDRVRALLLNMYDLLRITNMLRSLEVLENFWNNIAGTQDWDRYMKAQNWDFLPY